MSNKVVKTTLKGGEINMTTQQSIKESVLEIVMELSKPSVSLSKEKREAVIGLLQVIHDFILTDRVKEVK